MTRQLVVESAQGIALVMDKGRPDLRHEGVPVGGALVPELLRWANEAVANAEVSAGIEVYGRVTFRATEPTWCAVVEDWDAYDALRVVRVEPEAPLVVASSKETRCAYLAPAGGVQVPVVMGSRSTLPTLAIGGFYGRPLRRGDALDLGLSLDGPRFGAEFPRPSIHRKIGIFPGPDAGLVPEECLAALIGNAWTVARESDRMGYRLVGPSLEGLTVNLSSGPTAVGAIQLPPSGAPIVLGPDAGTIGGYPIIAVVQSADLGRFFARKPGTTVGFEMVG